LADDEVPEGTFGSYAETNSNAKVHPSRYEICDQSGFKVEVGTLTKQWDGAMVMKRFRDERNEQDFLRPRAERPRNLAKSPEPEIEYLSTVITQDDL
jgi:hypothetical protein